LISFYIYVLDDEKIDLFEFNNDVWVTDQDVTDDSEYHCSILIFRDFYYLHSEITFTSISVG